MKQNFLNDETLNVPDKKKQSEDIIDIEIKVDWYKIIKLVFKILEPEIKKIPKWKRITFGICVFLFLSFTVYGLVTFINLIVK